MKICIVKLSSIGDIAHNAFVPELIKQHIPNAKIHWVCDRNFTDILQYNRFIDKTHPVISKNAGKNITKFIYQFKKIRQIAVENKFDFVIDLQGTLKSSVITRTLSTNPNVFGFKFTRDIIANKLYNKHCTTPLEANVYERAIQMLQTSLEVNVDKQQIKTPFMYVKDNKASKVRDILIFPSSSKKNKNYSIENYRKIISQMQNKSITLLFNHKQEEVLCGKIADGFNNISIKGGLPLGDVKHEVLNHSCVIGGDTGVLHIATGLGVKNITLYGPTPSYRTSINKNHSISLQGNGDVNKIPTREVILAIKRFNI